MSSTSRTPPPGLKPIAIPNRHLGPQSYDPCVRPLGPADLRVDASPVLGQEYAYSDPITRVTLARLSPNAGSSSEVYSVISPVSFLLTSPALSSISAGLLSPSTSVSPRLETESPPSQLQTIKGWRQAQLLAPVPHLEESLMPFKDPLQWRRLNTNEARELHYMLETIHIDPDESPAMQQLADTILLLSMRERFDDIGIWQVEKTLAEMRPQRTARRTAAEAATEDAAKAARATKQASRKRPHEPAPATKPSAKRAANHDEVAPASRAKLREFERALKQFKSLLEGPNVVGAALGFNLLAVMGGNPNVQARSPEEELR